MGEEGGFEEGGEGGDGLRVGVYEEEGDDFVWVEGEPAGHGGEEGLEGAGVEEVAEGVAELEGVVVEVDLSL